MTVRRCPQCWKWRPFPSSFIGRRGAVVKMCTECQAKYRNWQAKSPEERIATKRGGVRASGALRARLIPRSHNAKLGGIPASFTSRGTCPPSCSFYDAGCYALYGKVAQHWKRTGEKGDSWSAFCADVAALPPGTLWRHNVAGDLPGRGEALDVGALLDLAIANVGRRGFTFTTCRLTRSTRPTSSRRSPSRRSRSSWGRIG